MKYLFQLNHPAHYHLFKNTMAQLKKDGHEILILARPKDMLIDLLKDEQYDVIQTKKGENLIQKLKKRRQVQQEILRYAELKKPDMIIGTGDFSYVTTNLGIPSIFCGEDDANLNIFLFLWALTVYGNFSMILAPQGVNNSIWNKKTTFYDGYHKLAYLHPHQFTPNPSVVEKYFPVSKPYFILRFAKLNAYHDVNSQGINTEIADNLIRILAPHGDVYITSERPLEPQFEKYRLNIDPLDIHHVMFYSTLYVGDSQSMAVESAMLGVPSIRFNDFAGKISVLEELEHRYGLTFGIKTENPQGLYAKVNELLALNGLRDEFQRRKQHMLNDKIDVTAFFVWLIENYPESKAILKTNPAYPLQFK